MKKRIYLFCNETYGNTYFKIFQEFAGKYSNFEYYVVFSSKGISVRFFNRITSLIKHPIKCAFKCYRWIICRKNGLKLTVVEDVNCNNFVESIPIGSIGFIAGFNQIFRKPIIDRFSLFINFHPSLLPYYRGAIPSYWVIKNKETITGFTAHIVSEEIDSGEIVYQELVEVNRDILEAELDCKIAAVGSYYFRECLKAIMEEKPLRQRRIDAKYLHKVDYVSSVRK